MPQSCAAVGCKEVGVRSGRSFHHFPSDPVLRKAWAVKVNREVRDPVTGRKMLWMPLLHHRLCSAHFEENCFTLRTRLMNNIPCYSRRMLLPDAVPSIFNHNLEKRRKIETIAKKRTVVAKKQRLEIIAQALNQGGVKTETDLLKSEPCVPIMITDKSSPLLTPWAVLKIPNILPQKSQSFTSAEFENNKIKIEPFAEAKLLQSLTSGREVSSLIPLNYDCVEKKSHDLDSPEWKFELKTEEDDQLDKRVLTEIDMLTKSDKTMLSDYFNTGEWKVEVNADWDCESDAEELKAPALTDIKHEMPEFSNASIETAQDLGRENPEVNEKSDITDQCYPLLDKVKVEEENGADVYDGRPSQTQSHAKKAVPTASVNGTVAVPSPEYKMVSLLQIPTEANCTVAYVTMPPKSAMVVRYVKIPFKPASAGP